MITTTTRMMTIMMTKETILDELKHARNRYKQAQIIADQCCCKQKDIIDLAEQNGIIINKRTGKRWTESEIETMKQMRTDGKGIHEISIKVGRTYQAVQNKLDRMGLSSINVYAERPDGGGIPTGRLALKDLARYAITYYSR